MKTHKKALMPILAFALIVPLPALAAFGGIRQLIIDIGGLITLLTKVAAAAALLVFFYGLMKFIFRVGGDEKAVDDGKRIMKWGLIALFVMLSVWGIIAFIQRDLGLPVNVPDGRNRVEPTPTGKDGWTDKLFPGNNA